LYHRFIICNICCATGTARKSSTIIFHIISHFGRFQICNQSIVTENFLLNIH
ncbi:unnamed protein product, partial [Schistosoma turkestanicum]